MHMVQFAILLLLGSGELVEAGSAFSCFDQSCPGSDDQSSQYSDESSLSEGQLNGESAQDALRHQGYLYKGILPDVFVFPAILQTELRPTQESEYNSESLSDSELRSMPEVEVTQLEREHHLQGHADDNSVSDSLRKTPRCIGPMPSDLDLSPIFGPQWVSSLQSIYPNPRTLCARTEYGGNPLWNAGGFCGSQIPSPISVLATVLRPRRINFDVHDAIGIAQVQMFCSLRCRCDGTLRRSRDDRASLIAGAESVPPDVYDPNPLTGDFGEALQMSNALFNHERRAFNFGVLHKPDGSSITTRLWVVVPPQDWRKPEALSVRFPTWLQDYLYTYIHGGLRYDEITPRQVCMSSWHSDFPINAGFFCLQHTDSTQILEHREWLSHPALLPTIQPYGLALHLFCRATLWCVGDESLEEPRSSVRLPYWDHQDVKGEMQIDGSRMRIVTRARRNPTSQTYKITLGPVDEEGEASTRRSGIVSPCGYYKVDNCTGRWPVHILPLLGRPPILEVERSSGYQVRQSVGKSYRNPDTKYTCGSPCRGFSDCTSKAGFDCRCVVSPSARQMAATGKSTRLPIAHAAYCIPLQLIFAASMSGGNPGVNVIRGLRGRALTQYKEGDTVCRCNETYTATACCFNSQGIF